MRIPLRRRARDGVVKRALFVAICRFGMSLGPIPIERSFRKHDSMKRYERVVYLFRHSSRRSSRLIIQ